MVVDVVPVATIGDLQSALTAQYPGLGSGRMSFGGVALSDEQSLADVGIGAEAEVDFCPMSIPVEIVWADFESLYITDSLGIDIAVAASTFNEFMDNLTLKIQNVVQEELRRQNVPKPICDVQTDQLVVELESEVNEMLRRLGTYFGDVPISIADWQGKRQGGRDLPSIVDPVYVYVEISKGA